MSDVRLAHPKDRRLRSYALRALQHTECSTHLASGVNLMLLPSTSMGMAIAGMTSVLGRCHTFDSRADGFVRGEGCSAAVIGVDDDVGAKRRIVLCGSAGRQDGRSVSLSLSASTTLDSSVKTQETGKN